MLRLTQAQANRLLKKNPAKPKAVKATAQLDGHLLEPGYLVLVLPVPPSKNADPKNVFARQNQHDHWANTAAGAWLAAGLIRMETVEISPVFYFSQIRKRDQDNCVGNAMKGIIDGLKGNLVTDDNSELLTLHAAELLIDRQYPRLELHVLEVV